MSRHFPHTRPGCKATCGRPEGGTSPQSLSPVFGAESAIWPDSLRRAGALGLLCRLLPVGVVDAEGLEDGAEGEDKARGNGRKGTFNKDITECDGCETLRMTQTLFHLEPMWCAHTANVRMMRCGDRTRKNVRVCASGKVVLCTPPLAFSELRLTGRETQPETISGWRSDLVFLVDSNIRLVFLKPYLNLLKLGPTSFEHKSMLSITSGLTIDHPSSNCVGAILASLKTTRRTLRRGR